MIRLNPCGCGGRAKATSDEYGRTAWTYVFCTKCGTRVPGQRFSIYYRCKCAEFRNFMNAARQKWNTVFKNPL